MNPISQQSNLPGFISIADAAKKYKTSRVNINNKIKEFKKKKGREIDRLQSGSYKLINEGELQEALRFSRPMQEVFLKVAA
jgi:biotin operon repressor